MPKFCLLPISLFLLSQGFANDKVAEFPFLSETTEERSDTALLSSKELTALDISDLKEEISTIMKKELSAQEDWINDDDLAYEQIPQRNHSPRVRQPLSIQEMIDEEDFQEEVVEIPASKHRFQDIPSSSMPRIQSERSTDVEHTAPFDDEHRQGTHVRRYPSHRAQNEQDKPRLRSQSAHPQVQMPKGQEDTADLDLKQPQQLPQKTPSSSPQNRPSARPSNPSQHKASQRKYVKQEDTADLDLKQPQQLPQKTPSSSPQNRPSARPSNPSQQKSTQQNAQQRMVPQQNARKHSAYDKNGSYIPPSRSSEKARISQQQRKTDPLRNQMDRDDQMDDPNQMQKNGTQKPMMSNTSVRPTVKKGWDIWIVGDVLLWQAVEENLTYAYTGNNLGGQRRRDLHTVDFDWDWGFRLGAGYNTPREGWDLDLYWTHIHNSARESVHRGTNQNIFLVWTVATSNFISSTIEKASANWDCHLDQLDLDLGREYYVGTYLTVRPSVGLRSTWLFQEYDVKYRNTQNLEQKAILKNRFWGFGFTAGIDTDWKFGYGISLYGEADISILLGFHDVIQRGKQQNVNVWSQDKSFRVGRPILDLEMGLKWQELFGKDSFGLTLKAGYEYHVYFDQNQYILTNGNSTLELFNPVGGNLIYQGVIGSIQFDF